MKITTLWAKNAVDEPAWLVSAYDEFTEMENNGPPEPYKEEKVKLKEHYELRELDISISDEAVENLFKVPTTQAKTIKKKE